MQEIGSAASGPQASRPPPHHKKGIVNAVHDVAHEAATNCYSVASNVGVLKATRGILVVCCCRRQLSLERVLNQSTQRRVKIAFWSISTPGETDEHVPNIPDMHLCLPACSQHRS